MTNSLHPPAALRLRVLHSQGKAPTVCSVFLMKLPGSSFFPMDLRYAAASISATAPPLCSHSSTAPPLSSRSATAPPLCSRSATEPRPATAPPQRPAISISATAPLPATPPQRPRQQQLCHGVPASNKPHPAEKSTPVWLAIWRTWAGFANSQHRDATFATPDNICAHSFLLPHWAAAQTDANLSAHLHRLPTPPPYLRRMRLSLAGVEVSDGK